MFVPGPACRLWVSVVGDGDPVTVVAHGLTSSSADLSPLAPRGTVVSFDFRGHGRSESPADARYDVPAMAADLDSVARAYGATRALGVSLGASAILNLLSRDPRRFDAITLVIPPQIDGPMPGVDAYAWLAQRLAAEPRHRIVDDMLGSEPVRAIVARAPVWEERLRGLGSRLNAEGMVRALREAPGGAPPVADASALAHVRAPVLIAGHENDPAHEASVPLRLARVLPNARVEIAPEPYAMLDDMEAFGRHAEEFMAMQGARA